MTDTNDIKTIDHLFDEAMLAETSALVESVAWAYGSWHSNPGIPYVHWNYDFCRASGKNIASIEDRLPAAVMPLWLSLKRVLPEGTYPIRNYANIHTYGVEGFPHTDSNRADEITAVVYLSKEWRREWAGSTVFFNREDDIIKAVMPKYGRVSLFPATTSHAASPVSRICPVARITMAIKTRSPLQDKRLMELEDFLREVGAHKMLHGKGSLMGHLVRVYEVLKAAGASSEICVVGGLHSIYGTWSYRDACLSDRGVIRERFGTDVEAFVYEFSGLNKDPDPTMKPLLAVVAAANLSDQGKLKDHPELEKFWNDSLQWPSRKVRI